MSKINTNREQPDLLEDLFKHIPEEELPASFRSNVMRQIMLESAKAKKRDERFSLLAAIATAHHDLPRDRIFHIHGNTPDNPSQDKHVGLVFLYLYREHRVPAAMGRLQTEEPIQEETKMRGTRINDFSKLLSIRKKALPLPRFLREDNIKSNLLIKTNLVLTIKEWKI